MREVPRPRVGSVNARSVRDMIGSSQMRAASLAIIVAGLAAGASCGGTKAAVSIGDARSDAGPVMAGDAGSRVTNPWLHTDGNRILYVDNGRFHGRGADLNDTRSCNACTYQASDPGEVIRRADALIDDWHATLVRFLLESYPTPSGRVQWQGVLDDAQYFSDVQMILQHFAERKTYVLLSLWSDPTFTPLGWPTALTGAEWAKLATALRDNPYVIYGVANEPAENFDGSLDTQAWTAMNDVVATIRATEPASGPHHLIAVQGTGGWSRRLDYYRTHPITAGAGVNVIYEEHFYNPASALQTQLLEPAQTLPVIVAEFGPEEGKLAVMTLADCTSLINAAEANEIPWISWSFHFRCPPNLLADRSDGGCGVGSALVPTDPYGTLIKTRLASPW